MKRILLCGMLLLAGIPIFANQDTTVTSFEIHLKGKTANYTLGFNSASLDRQRLYNAVMHEIEQQLETTQIRSMHQPYVLLKFHEYLSEKESELNHISASEQKHLDSHPHNYFIKVSGHLKTQANSIFTLKVCVFDANGKLIAKCKARSTQKHLDKSDAESARNISETEFIEMVSNAAMNLRLQI